MFFSKFKGIIFDLDGTLINSDHAWHDVDLKFMAKRGLQLPEDYCKAVSTMNLNQAAVYTKERFGLAESIEEITQEWLEMVKNEYSHNIFIKDGVREFLVKLKEKGVKIALATAASKTLYEPVLKNNGIYDFFEFYASTEQAKRGKGFPDVYEFACEGLGLKPCECAVFEDIIEGVKAAKEGGFTSVACLDKGYIAEWEKMKQTADCWFEDYNELNV